MDANRLTGTDYQYNLYNEYLDQMDGILNKYGQQTGLSIQYWHIRVDLSMNYDDLKMQNSYKHYVYDILHFVPTINMTPITYTIGFDASQQGTSNVGMGSFNLYLVDKPLPGDLFKFYTGGDINDPKTHGTDTTEIFRITEVRYVRSTKNKLNLYQLDFETAPILVETMEHIRINQIMCWDTERHLFLDEVQCEAMTGIVDNRDEIISEINKYYDPINGWYGLCRPTLGLGTLTGNLSEDGLDYGNQGSVCNAGANPGDVGMTRPLVYLNTIIKRLKRIFDSMDVKPIFGIGTAKIPIAWAEPANGDYWDTFTCLSFHPEANQGELFNVTQILLGLCEDCPQELIDEIECHRELVTLVQRLVLLLKPLLTEEQYQDRTCDNRCCDARDINYIIGCAAMCAGDTLPSKYGFDDFFWDFQGNRAGDNAPDFCKQYENAVCVPLYITWKDGAHWPSGGITPSGLGAN